MSLCGGQAVIPQSIIFSIRKASDMRNTDPILFKLLTLSKIKIKGIFSEALKSCTDFRTSSSFFSLRINGIMNKNTQSRFYVLILSLRFWKKL